MPRYRAANSGRHYYAQVSGAGEAVLLLHGFSGDHASWSSLTEDLREKYQIIAPDILGHGASDAPRDAADYRMGAVAADIVDLLDQLSCRRCHLLGYSMGGRLALNLALSYPDRFSSLILESASPGLARAMERDARRQRDEALADKIEARGVDWFVDYWERLPLWASQARLPADVLAAQRTSRRRNRPVGLANSLRGMGGGAQPSHWIDLPRLQLPTLLIVGQADAKFVRINRAMARGIPRSTLEMISRAGHNTHLEDPAAFRQTVASFLARPM